MKKYILAFDAGAKGIRYINEFDEKNGTFDENSAKIFDTREEAQKFNDDKGYICWVQEIETDELIY